MFSKKLSSKIVSIDYVQKSGCHQSIDADANLEILTNIIASLVRKINLEKKDKKLLTSCVESLIHEVPHVYKVNKLSAKGIVSDYMMARASHHVFSLHS